MAFSNDVKKWVVSTSKKANAVHKKLVFELFSEIVGRSPVDTGRFRANNQIGIDGPVGFTVSELDPSDGKAPANISDNNQTVMQNSDRINNIKPGKTIYITNNVEYGTKLEGGSSKQAPHGVYLISAQNLVQRYPQMVEEVKASNV
jgi:hypothetical protein